jgi:hypothetical protein
MMTISSDAVFAISTLQPAALPLMDGQHAHPNT